MPFAQEDEMIGQPVRTFAYACHSAVAINLYRARSIDDVIDAFEPLINSMVRDLKREKPAKILAVDTDLKGLAVITACKRLGVPVTTFVASVTSQVEAHSRRPCQQFVPVVEKYCLEQSARLIFPSTFASTYCRKQYPTMAPSVVIYNGIANAFLTAARLARTGRKIGAVMRLSGVKNPEMLGRVAEELRKHDYDVELVATVQKSHFKPRCLDHVRVVPPMSSADTLAQFYGSCDAIVCPSKFEASGNVPMESIAAGTPAVITNQMGVAELFSHLNLGHLVVEVNDLKATIDRLLKAQPVTDRVRAFLKRHFAWPEICREIIAAL
jgi:glycosyltransferase involved in cell wall biosynthesis